MAKTPTEVCVEYALAVEAVREQTRILRDNRCPNESSDFIVHGMTASGDPSCLDEFFRAPRGPDGEFPRFSEFYDPMCDACKLRLRAIRERKDARKRLGAAKRSIESAGKRELRANS